MTEGSTTPWERQEMEAIIRELEARLSEIKGCIQEVLHEHESLQREKITAMQALADVICHPKGPTPDPNLPASNWPSKIRMHTQRGLEGWCKGCVKWHPWTEWLKLMGLVEGVDDDDDEGPMGWNEQDLDLT